MTWQCKFTKCFHGNFYFKLLKWVATGCPRKFLQHVLFARSWPWYNSPPSPPLLGLALQPKSFKRSQQSSSLSVLTNSHMIAQPNPHWGCLSKQPPRIGRQLKVHISPDHLIRDLKVFVNHYVIFSSLSFSLVVPVLFIYSKREQCSVVHVSFSFTVLASEFQWRAPMVLFPRGIGICSLLDKS